MSSKSLLTVSARAWIDVIVIVESVSERAEQVRVARHGSAVLRIATWVDSSNCAADVTPGVGESIVFTAPEIVKASATGRARHFLAKSDPWLRRLNEKSVGWFTAAGEFVAQIFNLQELRVSS